MAQIHGKWLKLDQHGTPPGARSSHAVALVNNKAYVFGGEFTPRVPVDKNLYIFDLDSLTWSIADASGEVPPPRVGVTMEAVGDTIYVFGGRDADHKELDEFYAFDTKTSVWSRIDGFGPPHRSYHSMTADERFVYVFGGCGVAGRLNDLAAFDTVEREWVQFPKAEGCLGRGGPGLVFAAQKLWVVYGFAGKEMDDVHCFDPTRKKWTQLETKGEKPSARSVFSTAVIGKYVFIYGGEIDPSDQGHLGAGMFNGEVYALDMDTLEWKKCRDAAGDGEHHPGPRGWCAFAAGKMGGEEGLLVYGGNSPSNDRLDDMFFFTPESNT